MTGSRGKTTHGQEGTSRVTETLGNLLRGMQLPQRELKVGAFLFLSYTVGSQGTSTVETGRRRVR